MLENETRAHIRGTGSYRARAGFELQLGARIFDGSLAVAAFFLAHRWLGLSPMPHAGWALAIAAIATAHWAIGRKLKGQTLGDRAWELRTQAAALGAPLLRPVILGRGEIARAIGLTAASIVIAAYSFDHAVFRQPVWARAEARDLDAYLPDLRAGEWEVLPFFYTLGAWPSQFNQKTVFYALPYEKAPPTRFVGHIVARWEDPDTRVVFEGPKTPTDAAPRARIRDCLLGGAHSWSCLKIREATLMRHLLEMQRDLTGRSGGETALTMSWQLEWFAVKNAAIAPAEQAQGLRVSATQGDRSELRYVLITENGTHQAISLLGGSPAAHATFDQAIRSLRASDELGPGRAWADRQLASVRLGDATRDNPALGDIDSLARAQALLLAKISVQPAQLGTYFHLGGTALMLGRLARQGSRAGTLSALELTAISKPLVQSAYRYAQDIDPKAAQTTQLQGFWIEAQKP